MCDKQFLTLLYEGYRLGFELPNRTGLQLLIIPIPLWAHTLSLLRKENVPDNYKPQREILEIYREAPQL